MLDAGCFVIAQFFTFALIFRVTVEIRRENGDAQSFFILLIIGS